MEEITEQIGETVLENDWSNSDEYAGIFNLWFYFKTIVDNILTLGFTVFDTLRGLQKHTHFYNEIGTPSL